MKLNFSRENFHHAMDWLYRACIWISGLSIIIMSIVIPWGVYARYVLERGAAWPEPVAVFCMVIFTFFGAAASYRAGKHIAVGIIVDRLSSLWQRLLGIIVDMLMLLLSLFMIVYGFRLSQAIWHQTVDTLPILKVGVTYLPLPLGGIALMLFVLERVLAGTQKDRSVVVLDQPPEQKTSPGESL